MWHIHSKRVALCWNSTGTREKKKNKPWQAQHQSFYLSECGRSSPRKIINCHISSLIKKKYECPIHSWRLRYISVMSHWTLLDWSKVKLVQSDAELVSPRQTVICYSPHMKAPLAVAAWLSARWQRAFNRQSYLSQNKLLQICETNIE